MKPTTMINIIIHFTCALAIFCSMLGLMALQGQNMAHREVSKLQQARILSLEQRVVQLSTMNEVMRVFDFVLPETYRAELAQIDYQLRYMGGE